jgi:putative transcriptional regulator
MAIRLRLPELLERRKLTQTELQARTGLAYSTVNDLYHGKTRRIELATLDVLCRALNCRVGDLLEYVPEAEDR